jgi:hypothetical protein
MPRAITATATPASPSPMVNLDSWQGSVMGVQAVPTGGAEYTIDCSFDNPNDLIAPIPFANMAFDTGLIPGTAIESTLGTTFTIMTAPIWIRVTLLNATGQVRATYVQVGTHSRSNIPIEIDTLIAGPNFANGNPRANGNGGPQ